MTDHHSLPSQPPTSGSQSPVTILLTAYREAATAGAAIAALLPQLPAGGELLVVCPDAETTAVVQQYAAQDSRVRHVADPGRGKPTALTIGLAAARGEAIIFSDGDVVVAPGAVAALLAVLEDAQVGAVSGRPLSSSPRHTMLGYWSHLLVNAAHRERLRRARAGDFLVCSGYLFAARKAALPPIPPDALAEDAVISHRVAEQGLRVGYAPEAIVYVKYPDSYADWLRQKVRSAGGYAQVYVRRSPVRMRSARLEARYGAALAWRFPRTWRERWWTVLLFAARLHLWLLIFWRVRVQKRPFADLWQRIESTK